MNSPSRLERFFHRNFRAYFRLKKRYERRFTPAGRFVLGTLIVCAVIGLDTSKALAYQAFSLLAALLLVALISRRRFAGRLSITRHLPRYATVGEPMAYRLRVSHDRPKTVRGLSLLEIHQDPRPDLAQFHGAREPGSERRNRYDRMIGYYRWTWLVRRNEVAPIDEIFIPALPPSANADVTHRLTPRFRGTLSLSSVAIARRDPLGLCRAWHIVDLPGTVLVLPRTYPLPHIDLPGQLHYQPEHRVSASRSGDGEEICGLREYRPGDPLRDIHWKSFARTGTPIVKEYQPEYFERHALLLDTIGASHGHAFEEAVSVAASFVGRIDGSGCLLDLLFVGAQCYCFTMGPGELQAEALMRVLAGVQPGPDESMQALHATVLGRRDELSGCIAILLAWDAERQKMMEELRQSGVPLLVLLVSERPPECPAWVRVLTPGRIEEGLRQT
jgi:uncharacterized protein (DUF58 family)